MSDWYDYGWEEPEPDPEHEYWVAETLEQELDALHSYDTWRAERDAGRWLA